MSLVCLSVSNYTLIRENREDDVSLVCLSVSNHTLIRENREDDVSLVLVSCSAPSREKLSPPPLSDGPSKGLTLMLLTPLEDSCVCMCVCMCVCVICVHSYILHTYTRIL